MIEFQTPHPHFRKQYEGTWLRYSLNCQKKLFSSQKTKAWSSCLLGKAPIKPPENPNMYQWLWIFTGRTDAEAETLILWLPDAKNWLLGKDPDVGKDRGQEERGVAEDEIVGWHYELNGHEFEQFQEIVKDREAWHAAVHEVSKSWTTLSDWPAISDLDLVMWSHLLLRNFGNTVLFQLLICPSKVFILEEEYNLSLGCSVSKDDYNTHPPHPLKILTVMKVIH